MKKTIAAMMFAAGLFGAATYGFAQQAAPVRPQCRCLPPFCDPNKDVPKYPCLVAAGKKQGAPQQGNNGIRPEWPPRHPRPVKK